MVWILLLIAADGWAERVNRLTIMHFNDIYEINPQRERGGFAPLMTLIERHRHRHADTLLTFGGDLLSPSVYSYLTRGKEMITLCNTLGVDVAVLGNHEFDFGLETLQQRLQGSRFPWLAANVRTADGDLLPHTRQWHIQQIGDLSVAFIGLLTPFTAELANLGQQVTFLDPIEVARQQVAALQQQGVDLIIALTHLTLAEDEALARQVAGIDLILGGHDHDGTLHTVGTTQIIKASSDGGQLAVVELTLLRPDADSQGKPRLFTDLHWLSTFRVPAHPPVQAMADAIEQRMSSRMQTVVATTAMELDSRESTVRAKESSLGNLFADAMRHAHKSDVSLLNGGSLRGNRLYAAGSPLTYGDIVKESPFGNTVVLLEISAEHLWQALEHGVAHYGKGAGRFLQIAGFSFRFNPQLPPGERVQEVWLRQGEQNVALQRQGTRRIKVATNDYLARGGDGFHMLKEGQVLVSAEAGKPLSTVVMDYLQQHESAPTMPVGQRILLGGP
ncbi:MAG: bifunctional metallophosphatase/5'-nucleotidase [Magnetococcales bacterium]|nr:bifunctional metallophosphatase/5'-nucleotidase [Magnetococcales bacterium]